MTTDRTNDLSRRDVLKIGLGAGLALTVDRLPRFPIAPLHSDLIERAIPSSGEKLPVVGIGTARNYEVATTPEAKAPLREVLRRFAELGGKVIDTAPAYGRAEEVVGELTAELAIRPKLFLATKVSLRGPDASAAEAQMNESMKRLRTDKIDLMQVWNVSSPDQLLPLLFEWKKQGKIRYVGVTTSSDRQYDALAQIMQTQRLDFIQVDYAIDNRNAADRLLPLAADRGQAVLINLPFGRPRGFKRVRDPAIPDWAKEIAATTWAQVFLKYIVSHPAVTWRAHRGTKTTI